MPAAAPSSALRGSSCAHPHPRPAASYERRKPEDGVLYRVLQEHLATFLNDAAVANDGTGVPRFVEKELRAFLKCGVLAHGFCRFRCADCSKVKSNGAACTDKTRVVPGDAKNSLFFQKLRGDTTACGAPMPVNADQITDPELERIKAWINAGACDN